MIDSHHNLFNLLLYFGGFSEIGGIEFFTKNLISSVSQFPVFIDLLTWGKKSELLQECSCKINNMNLHRFFWRWGCRYGLPDKMILWKGKRLIKKADLVIFGKTFNPEIHFSLDQKRQGHKPPFILITPYRPNDIWPITMSKQKMLIQQKVLETFDAIVVQSRVFEEDLRKLGYQKRIELLPYIPGEESSAKPLPDFSEGIKIGFLGRVEKQKNLELLLESFSLLTKLAPTLGKMELHFFGDGSQLESLKKIAQSKEIAGSVFWKGGVPHEKVPEAIDSCHLFAFSSFSEGQCMAALEIISRGRPIVATPVGALPDIVSNNNIGRIALHFDATEFAEALKKVIEDIYQKNITSEIIYNYYIKKYSRDKIIKDYWELFTSLLN